MLIIKVYNLNIFLFFLISFLFAIDGSTILKELGEKQYHLIKGIFNFIHNLIHNT